MTDVTQRLARLSPEQRKLLQYLLRNEPPAPAAELPCVSEAGITDPKRQTARFYDSVSAQLNSTTYGRYSRFLNYGYCNAGQPGASRIRLPQNYLNRNPVLLILELIGDCELDGRDVLDVGCGRGGALSVITQFFAPHQAVGIDLAPAAIAFNTESNNRADLHFLIGDAEKLPFADSSFDVVTNIESSHSYPDVAAFYREVGRVMRPGGRFLYTDLVPADRSESLLAELRGSGFILEIDRDITQNVLRSCDEIAGTRLHAFGAQFDSAMVHDFLAVPGSKCYEDMRTGRSTYFIFRFRKPLEPAGPREAAG